MKRALVIADDLTGAAEIAGLALRFGLPTRLVREPPHQAESGVTVIDTDSRLLAAPVAAETVGRFVRNLRAADFDFVYKKTDSVLRGPIRAELDALASHFSRTAVLLLAQNPSRQRTINRDGKYHINGIPLDQTAFAGDPEFPARTAVAAELIGGGFRCLPGGSDLPAAGRFIGAGESSGDLREWAARTGVCAAHLPAGGADFFQSILEHRGFAAERLFVTKLSGDVRLFVCGSASAYTAELVTRAQREGIPICPMPADLSSWPGNVITALGSSRRALMTIGRPVDQTAGAPQRLQSAMADAVAKVLAAHPPDCLMMEGGATAAAVCARMGWGMFTVEAELATGVVQLAVTSSSGAPTLLIKPGSYPWPDAVWR